jgi:hypothetical protein
MTDFKLHGQLDFLEEIVMLCRMATQPLKLLFSYNSSSFPRFNMHENYLHSATLGVSTAALMNTKAY